MGLGNSDEDKRAPRASPNSPQSRPRRRDALIALSSPGLAAMAMGVTNAFGFRAFLADSSAHVAASASERAFDLILLEADAETGALVRRIRALPGASPPIIALGACRGDLWREDAADAGVDGFIDALETPSRLIDMVALLMGAQRHASSLIRPTELDPVQHDDGDEEDADGNDRGHVFPGDS